MKKIPKEVFKYIEFELYSYKGTMNELKLDEDDAIYGTKGFDINSGIRAKFKKSSPVESSLMNLSTKRIVKLVNTINQIDNALNKLDKIYRDFFEKYYCKRMSSIQISDDMHIHEKTCYNYRKKIVTVVAAEMGLINYE